MIPQDIIFRQQKQGWLAAVVVALAINLILLSILPVVNLGTMTLPKNPPPSQPVRFVRLTPPALDQPNPADQPPVKTARPEVPGPPPPETIDPAVASLERTLRPDLPAVSVPIDFPRLSDMPPATVDFQAMGIDGVFNADELDQPLMAVSRPPPFYPLQARRAAIEGWVEVAFQVNTDGEVEDVNILNAQPPGVFENSVRQAVTGWRFQPGTVMGEPVRARVRTTVRFELENGS